MSQVALKNISKHFGAFAALDGVDLQVEKGTIHAIVGENGAGKTTLMKVLYGALQPDAGGEIILDGQAKIFHRSEEAIRAGVGMVSQHYGIIGELTCLQNLIMGAEPGFGLSLEASRQRAQQLADQMGFSFDWNALASTLSPGGAQKLEILKLLWRNSRVMILDEPTAMLSPADSDALFASLKVLAAAGNTILVVTHRIPEVMDHCQRVTVLRGGKRVADVAVSETNPSDLAAMIVGESLAELEAPMTAATGDPGLNLKDLVVKGYRGDEAVKAVSLQIAKGEVLGVAGVDGNGQRELIQAIAGWVKTERGSLQFLGDDWTAASVRHRLEAGLRLIPEDRPNEGIIEDWSLEENALLGQQWLAPFADGRKLHAHAGREVAERMAARFNTKFTNIGQAIRGLSGGNQQRFVAGRALESDPKLVVAFQPARGLDLKATREVYAAIREACRGGACALIVSFDLDELLAFCDRVVAMNRGQIFEPAPEDARSREAIGRLMVTT